MGKPVVGGQKRGATGGSDALVDARKGSQRATKETAGGPVKSGGPALGTPGAPRLRSRLWARSLAQLPLVSSAALCGAVEKRQQAAGCLRAGAQSLGNRPWQTALGRGAAALGHPFPCLSQHAGACLAGASS